MIESKKEEQTCFFMGHREINPYEFDYIKRSVREETERLIQKGYINFICGGELGFDTLAALTVLELKRTHKNIKLLLALSSREQTNGWLDKDILLYNDIVSKSDDYKIISQTDFKGAVKFRNKYMIEKSTACIVYLRKIIGETASALNYIQSEKFSGKMNCIKI